MTPFCSRQQALAFLIFPRSSAPLLRIVDSTAWFVGLPVTWNLGMGNGVSQDREREFLEHQPRSQVKCLSAAVSSV